MFKYMRIGLALGLLTLVVACGGEEPTATPTATRVAVATPTPTRAVVATPTPTQAPAATPTSTPTPAPEFVPFKDTYYANPPRAWTEKDIRTGGTMISTYSGDAPHYDNDLTTSYYTLGVVGPVYNRLVHPKYGSYRSPYAPEIVPDLAERWEVGGNGLEYTFYLRKGVKWQDSPYVDVPGLEGREFVCDDAKYSLERDGEGASAFLVSSVDTITCVDNYTLKVTLGRTDPGFFPNQGASYAGIIPREVVEQEGDLKTIMLGTGPFILKEHKPKTSYTYERNPNYYAEGLPYLDAYKIVVIPEETSRFAAFRTEQVLYLGSNNIEAIDALLGTHPKTVVHGLHMPSSSFHVAFNAEKAPWSDVNVRRAVSMAMNREEMNDLVYAGRGKTYALGIPWSAVFDELPPPEAYGPYYQYNPDEAKRLLALAGYENGIKNVRWDYYAYGIDRTQQSEIMQQYLAAIGIEIDIQRLDYGVWAQTFHKNRYEDLALGFTVPAGGMALGYDWTYELMRCEGIKNLWDICDPVMDQLLEDLRTEVDPAKQRPIMRKIWDRAVDQVYRAYVPQEIRYSFWHPWVKNTIGWGGYRFDQFTYGASHVEKVWLDDSAKYK